MKTKCKKIKKKHTHTLTKPKSVYGWWIARDTIHVIGAAVMPDYLEQKLQWNKETWTKAQLSFPVAIQLLTTPCHLLGLQAYNNPESSFKQRLIPVFKNWIPSAATRGLRMFGPWSIGLLINRDLRDYFMEKYT